MHRFRQDATALGHEAVAAWIRRCDCPHSQVESEAARNLAVETSVGGIARKVPETRKVSTTKVNETLSPYGHQINNKVNAMKTDVPLLSHFFIPAVKARF